MDVLQQTIKKFAAVGALNHPIFRDQPCPVLQYADDTLIVLEGNGSQARLLKEILDAFANFLGLHINFTKSTFVPINLSDEEEAEISDILECPVATFPQTYLGLPLSDSKLPKAAFLPLISKIDRRLASFSMNFISRGGRLILTKSVLSALPAYFMSCLSLPKWVIEKIDGLRRSFFWKGKNSSKGSDCLVSWEQVCKPVDEGGPGIKNLELQNKCLLASLVHRLHVNPESSWAKRI